MGGQHSKKERHPFGKGELHNNFHGDPSRDNKFWVYPRYKALITRRWDTHKAPHKFCTNCERVGPRGDIEEYRCLGHIETDQAEHNSTIGSGELHDGFHGDPARAHHFWVYPPHQRLVTARWDTHLRAADFCGNCVSVQKHRDGKLEFRCLGHSTSSESQLPTTKLEEKGPSRMLPAKRGRIDSLEMIDWWTKAPQSSAPAEYHKALESICIRPEIMSTCGLGRTLKHLDGELRLSGAGSDFKDTVTKSIKVAFKLSSNSEAREYRANQPGVASGHIYQGALSFHNMSSSWQKPYIKLALHKLTTIAIETQDTSMICLTLGFLRIGADECAARRRWVFTQMLEAVHNALKLQEDQVSDDRSRLCNFLQDKIDQYKEEALDTVFLQPSMAYFRFTGDSVMEGDVDVHGANCYLALLLSTLGVLMNRRPFLRDEVKGIVNFNGTTNNKTQKLVALLWSDSNFGRAWGSVQSDVPQQAQNVKNSSQVRTNQFLFGRHGCAMELANRAVDPDNSMRQERQVLATYLEQWAHYFSKGFLLQRLINAITSDDVMTGIADRALQEMLSQHAEGREAEGFRHFVWEFDDEYNVEFKEEKAVEFLQYIQVLK